MITFAIFTCNRLLYFRNCIESVLEFVDPDDINILVVDSNTKESGFSDYISSLPPSVDIKIFPERSPNELYRGMNYAIEYARKKGDKYLNCIQDDYQYLYKMHDFARVVDGAFNAKSEVVQVQTNMVWKRKHHKTGKVKFMNLRGHPWIYLYQCPPCDNGIFRLSLFDKIGLYPKNVSMYGTYKGFNQKGENWLRRKSKGYKRIISAQPNMAMMIDCAYVRGDERHGKYLEPVNKYYLKPFSEEEQQIVKNKASKNKWCFIEEMVEPDGWKPDSLQKHSTRDIVVKLT